MALQAAKDIPIRISSASTASERRVTPSWTVSQFKARLEPITGVPATSQKLVLKDSAQPDRLLEAIDDDTTQLSTWDLRPYVEIYFSDYVKSSELLRLNLDCQNGMPGNIGGVCNGHHLACTFTLELFRALQVDDTRPAAARNLDLTDLSSVEKYTMPEDTYAGLSDSVLAWKKNKKLGRFDPNAPEIEREKIEAHWSDVEKRGVEVGKRCRLGTDSARRGLVSFVGEVPEIPGLGGPYVGVTLDEPTGKNDGSVGGKRYFTCPIKRGVFVRPERVDIGDFGQLLDEENEDMEEI